MKLIWAIIVFFAICSSSDAESDVDSFASDIDAEKNITSDQYDFEGDSDLQNITDESDNHDGEGLLSVVPVVPKTEIISEVEVTTTDFASYVPEHRRKSQPRLVNGTCGDPPSIQHAVVVGDKTSSFSPGAVIRYSCEFGYVADGGVRTVQCSDSLQWTKPTIICFPRPCGDPGMVNNAVRVGSLFTFPNSVTFECEEGYKLRGIGIRYCQPSGTWSGTLPTCHKLFCDKPPEIENGQVSYSSLEFGSELRYQCNNGFILRKHQPRFCSADGKWSGEDPVCQDFQCESPNAPKHGSVQVIGGRSSVNSRAIYTCEGDRVLVGSKTSICLETGEWTFATPKCLDPCSVPEVPNGKIGRYERFRYSERFKELSVGTRVENNEKLYLRCDNNYSPLGKSSTEEQIVCYNGEWKDNPRCEPVSCRSDPPATPNAKIASINRKHGGIVVYHCLKLFHKTQFGNVSCNFGSWRGNTPICSDTRCYSSGISFPGLVKGNKKTFFSGQSVAPVCDSKYTTTKNSRLSCRSGVWTVNLPPCTAASCQGDPPSIENGRWKSYSPLHSSIVTYECDDNFSLEESKSSKVECLFGKWEGIPPTCKDNRCYQQDLQNTEGIIINDAVIPSGEFLTVSCKDGYSSTGVEPHCSNGVWSVPSAPCKEDDCFVDEISHGRFVTKVEKKIKGLVFTRTEISFEKVNLGEMKSPRSFLYVECNSGYTFQGKRKKRVGIWCSNGRWIPRPVCLIPGTDFRVESTTVLKPRTTSTINPTLTTPNSLIVTEAGLHRNMTHALEECTCTYVNWDPKLVAYSGTELVQNDSKVKNNCKVTFHCSLIGYYRLMGPVELICKDCKPWHSSEYPQCIEPATGDAVLEFHTEHVVLPNGIIAVQEGKPFRVSCFANKIATYPTWWRIPTDKNVRIYHDSGYIPQTWITVYLTVLYITNTNPEHSGTYGCRVGEYRSKEIEMQVIRSPVQCPHIEENSEIAVHYDKGQEVNSSVFISCKENNSKLEGSSVLTCLPNGQWSGDLPKCKSQCPKLEEGEGMSITYSQGLDVDSTAVFHCFQPRVRTGEAHSKCKKNGQWSNPVPSCSLPSCLVESLFRTELPENVISDMENVNSENVPFNFTLRLKCEKEFVLLGSDTARCGKDGKWEVPDVQCVLGCISLTSTGTSLIIEPEKSVYRFGEFITLSCPPKQALSSDVVRIMCLNNGWSETEIPHCKDE